MFCLSPVENNVSQPGPTKVAGTVFGFRAKPQSSRFRVLPPAQLGEAHRLSPPKIPKDDPLKAQTGQTPPSGILEAGGHGGQAHPGLDGAQGLKEF